MRRFINQMNVSITTNRTCNLKCDHCYILPEVFKNKTKLSMENFKKIFDVIESLNKYDHNLEEIEWETLGGETTLMPYEYWEEALPYALSKIKHINKSCNVNGCMNFISNLMINDKRYFELFNNNGKRSDFTIYTSWEPDTNRFGKKNEKFPMFKNNIKLLKGVENKTLDIIFTKGIIELGPLYIIKTFVPLGINDFSFKMLSPYGSGKKFFENNMISFKEMEDYLLKFDELTENMNGITFTPKEEVSTAAFASGSFQCNGNFYYDLTVEPDGEVTFNASQTADEAVAAIQKLYVTDKNADLKIIFGNIQEAFNKLELKHEECEKCPYLIFCNAGWYHYKINKEIIEEFKQDACSGYRKTWEKFFGDNDPNMRVPKLKLNKNIIEKPIYINEEELTNSYEEYFEFIKFLDNKKSYLKINNNKLFGSKIVERILFYDALNINLELDEKLFYSLPSNEQDLILKNIVSYNYRIDILPEKMLFDLLVERTDLKNHLSILENFINNNYIVDNVVSNMNHLNLEIYIYVLNNRDKFLKYFDLDNQKEKEKITNYDFEFLKHIVKYSNYKNI